MIGLYKTFTFNSPPTYIKPQSAKDHLFHENWYRAHNYLLFHCLNGNTYRNEEYLFTSNHISFLRPLQCEAFMRQNNHEYIGRYVSYVIRFCLLVDTYTLQASMIAIKLSSFWINLRHSVDISTVTEQELRKVSSLWLGWKIFKEKVLRTFNEETSYAMCNLKVLAHVIIPLQSYLNPNDSINRSIPEQNGYRFTSNNFKCIFVNKKCWIALKFGISLLLRAYLTIIQPCPVYGLAKKGCKALLVPLLTMITDAMCVTRPQWVTVILYLI